MRPGCDHDDVVVGVETQYLVHPLEADNDAARHGVAAPESPVPEPRGVMARSVTLLANFAIATTCCGRRGSHDGEGFDVTRRAATRRGGRQDCDGA